MGPFRIVITGAPASGKTEFFERLKDDSRFESFVFFDELARRLLAADPSLRSNRSMFHRKIYAAQVEQEGSLIGGQSFITDRGTLDAYAFHPELLDELGTSREVEYDRYSHVVYLQTAAALGEAFYKQDGIRTESWQDVIIIDRATCAIWGDHQRFVRIPALEDFEQKFDLFLEVMGAIVGTDGS